MEPSYSESNIFTLLHQHANIQQHSGFLENHKHMSNYTNKYKYLYREALIPVAVFTNSQS